MTTATIAITVNPAAGNSYIDLTSVVDSDITASPALAIGDQLEYENTTTAGALPVSISAGGVISVTGDPAGESFDVRAWDSSSPSWGAWATQSALIFSITSVDTDNRIYDGVTTVAIVGRGFGTTQGTVDIGGTNQTITSWTDLLIEFTADQASQSLGNATLTVKRPT